MDNSASETANRKGNEFDILKSQTEQSRKSVRFEDIPKPTELPPLPPSAVATEKKSNTSILGVKENQEKMEKFIVPKPLSEYINKLIKGGRKLKVLAFDVEEAISEEQVKNILYTKLQSGLINESEKKEMFNLLTNSKGIVESKKQEMPAMSEAKNEAVKLYVEEKDEHPVRSRRKKISVLQNMHGIVVEKVGETHTPVEKSIIDKSNKLWKGTNREMEISLQFLKDGSIDFYKEPEVVTVTPPIRSFDGILRKQVKEPIKEVAKEQAKEIEVLETPAVSPIVPPEKTTEKAAEKSIEKPKGKTEEKTEVKTGSNTLALDFQGKTVEVVRKENELTVVYDGKEIAKGTMTVKGPEIKINKEFKAGFLFAKTNEEKAFEKALLLIKTTQK